MTDDDGVGYDDDVIVALGAMPQGAGARRDASLPPPDAGRRPLASRPW